MPTKAKLSNSDKRRVAARLIDQAANLAEFWDELGCPDIPAADAADLLAGWLRNLPGESWDARLPLP